MVNGWITKSRYIDTYCEPFINTTEVRSMANVIYEGDDFKRMTRNGYAETAAACGVKKDGDF